MEERYKNRLRIEFEKGLEDWEKNKSEEYKLLLGALMLYGSAIPGEGTLWDALEIQIKYIAKKHDEEPIETVKRLFAAKDHDIFMLRLQV